MSERADSTADRVADELYALPPGEFIAARDERVRAARESGDRELATALGRLRRPTTSAWAVNLLARDQPDLLDQLGTLGGELREAQRELRGPALRELAAERQRVVAALVQTARRLAARAGHPASAGTAYEVEQTLHAALADPAVAREVCAGRLVHPAAPGGFGVDTGGGALGDEPADRSRPSRASRSEPAAPADLATGRGRGRGTGTGTGADGEPERERLAGERRRAEHERLQAAHDAARADHEAAEAELQAAEQRLTGITATRDEAAARIESLQEQLRAAQQDLRDASGKIRDAQRRRDVAARMHGGTADRLARLATRLTPP